MSVSKKTQDSFTPPSRDTLFGDIGVKEFLRDYWQKKPLLVRQAIPGFGDLLDPGALLRLACREDAESRLVRQRQGRWTVQYGPQSARALARLPERDWTVLVQGVNLMVPGADALMRAFDFIPYARLDDLMVSYAPDGGGVGPHFDSYDVFLIQGLGKRRWEIGAQQDKTLVEGAPLRILKDFRPEQTWDLEAGDMLYLPPQYAHNGVALGDCMTWSVGFRAYPARDIAAQFLNYLQDTLELEGVYSDPNLKPTRHPGKIPGRMVTRFAKMLRGIRWDKSDVADFIGAYLSEPKANVFFEPPRKPPSLKRFQALALERGVVLDTRSSLLYRKRVFHMNGEHVEVAAEHSQAIRELADKRRLKPAFGADASLLPLLYEWFCAGYLRLGDH
jgi:50S ribosomal protein L16 3-hydroxylase